VSKFQSNDFKHYFTFDYFQKSIKIMKYRKKLTKYINRWPTKELMKLSPIMQTRTLGMCSYCGERIATDNEHVFPRNLYPESKKNSRVQRLTIPSCNVCNNGWSDDEVYFRNLLSLAGKPNEPRNELWRTTIQRSFEKSDGHHRVLELIDSLKQVEHDGEIRHKVYLGQDPRILRIVRKIVRGLCHYHGVLSPVPEKKIWADVLKYHIQDEFIAEMMYQHREQDVAEYRYQVICEYGIQSAWLITFYQRVTLIGLVSLSEDGSFPERTMPNKANSADSKSHTAD